MESVRKREEVYRKFIWVMEHGKMYLDKDLNSEKVCAELSVNRSLLFSVLGEKRIGFTSIINSYRAAYAIDLLLDTANLKMSLEEIAELSGFGSARNMNLHIRYRAGVTAGALRERVFSKN